MIRRRNRRLAPLTYSYVAVLWFTLEVASHCG
jgi:hypothetical protein